MKTFDEQTGQNTIPVIATLLPASYLRKRFFWDSDHKVSQYTGLSIIFKSNSTSFFLDSAFLLKFSCISYTTLFNIRRYQRPF